ncbi:MAG: cyclic nucleotide-binding domain-containing protein [Rhodospirillaceae bacterium]|nr:MAG: cyclic nucleotide-binding domain-containing protein [Rhodospirillaceae bacterium]
MLAQNPVVMDHAAMTAAAVLSSMAMAAAPDRPANDEEHEKAPLLSFKANAEIYAEGDTTKVFYRVMSGIIRTCRFLADGRRQIEAFYSAGDIFGLDIEESRGFSAEAVTDCVVRSYQQIKIADSSDGVAVHQQLFCYAMNRLVKAQEHAMLLSRRSALEKVAAFLVEWSKRSKQQGMVTLAMTRNDIADYLGLTIETVSRTLTQLDKKNLIGVPTPRQIQVRDVHALKELYA